MAYRLLLASAGLAVFLCARAPAARAQEAAPTSPDTPPPIESPSPPAPTRPRILEHWKGPPPRIRLNVESEEMPYERARLLLACDRVFAEEGAERDATSPLEAEVVLDRDRPVRLLLRWRDRLLVERWIDAQKTSPRNLCRILLREAALFTHPAMGRLDPRIVPDAPPRHDVVPPPYARYLLLRAAVHGGVTGVHRVVAGGADFHLEGGAVLKGFLISGDLALFAGATRVGTQTLFLRWGPGLGGHVGRLHLSLHPQLGYFMRSYADYRVGAFTVGGEGVATVDLINWRLGVGALFASFRGGVHGVSTPDGWQAIYNVGLGIGVRP